MARGEGTRVVWGLSVPVTGALPHAHQPRAAGVRVPGVGHVAGNPLHGCPRV